MVKGELYKMAEENIITSREGSENFPTNVNDVYGLVETIASQNIASLKSTNKIIDGFYEYDVENGKVIEEAVIEMAQGQAFDKNAFNLTPTDPIVHGRYFNNWEALQYPTTIRRDDIRAILANKGVGLEDVVSKILDSLTQGEGNEDFIIARSCLYNAEFKNYKNILGGVPSSMKGVIYALRDMYNHLKSNNNDLTLYDYTSATMEDDIRIAVSTKVLNLIDVTELANIFNLEKEALFGKLVVIDVDDLSDHTYDGFVYVYDRKALGRATRLYDYTQDVSGKGRFTNHFLTVERAYFHNGLFKGAYLDCSEAVASAKADIITAPIAYSVTKTLSHATTTSTVASVDANEAYVATFVAGEGYTLEGATFEVTMGGTSIKATAYANGVVSVPHVKGNLVIKITAVENK